MNDKPLWDILHAERFCDDSVREVYATLLDEGTYIASVPTLYRLLAAVGETQERRRIATHPGTREARAYNHFSQHALELGHQ